MRGIIIFVIMIVFAIIFCGIVPFVALPSIDAAMALPVISVPGEVLIKDFPVLGTFTNTMVGTLLADLLVILFIVVPVSVFGLKRVPGRLQMMVELITDLFRNLATSVAGPKNGRRLFPMAATIFIFLLMANWLELLPGVDSVGLIHCAEEGMSGYDTQEFLGMSALKVSENLDAGTKATAEDAEACEARYHHGDEDHSADEEHPEDAAAVAAGESEGGEGSADVAEGTGTEAEAAEQAEGEEPTAEAAAETEAEVHDNIRIVTPFIRVAATDLNVTLALALIAVIFIQYLGVAELGWSYPAKFINTPALEKGDVMTFGVGFLELVSEISKIISFAFRLFGNIFAGQILLFVIPFLVATLLPGAIYGLEFAVGLIQAAVFAMLFLVFASIAMTGHDDHDEHH